MPTRTLSSLLLEAMATYRESHPGLTPNQVKQAIIAAARVAYPGVTVNGALWAYLMAQAQTYAAVILADTPVSYWRLGEPSGAVAFDLGSFGNDAAYVEGEAASDVAAWTPRAGIVASNDAVTFEEATRVLEVPSIEPYHEIFGSDHDFSCEWWMRGGAAVASANWFLMTLTGAAFSRMLYVYRNGADFPVLGVQRVSNDGLSDTRIAIPDAAIDGDWHHLVFTKDGMDLALYLDGAAVGTATDIPGISNGGFFTIGARTNAGQAVFQGALDEIALYDYPLSAEQVAAHFAARANG